jgi:hypothetical protein
MEKQVKYSLKVQAVRICDFSTHLGSVDLRAVSLHGSEAV